MRSMGGGLNAASVMLGRGVAQIDCPALHAAENKLVIMINKYVLGLPPEESRIAAGGESGRRGGVPGLGGQAVQPGSPIAAVLAAVTRGRYNPRRPRTALRRRRHPGHDHCSRCLATNRTGVQILPPT
ncbi:hypothetical protein AB0L88_40835 [Saccharopolyspora shandongensis]|uniref:hypothetical protein n=1 Tax=Saccharopolyspora shandongensis TaxID=418495 RepID=UPI00341919C5